jgi:hypothetical protein
MKKYLVLLIVYLVCSGSLWAQEYFGDINNQEFIFEFNTMDSAAKEIMHAGTFYLMLKDGQVLWTKSPRKEDAVCEGKLEIAHLDAVDSKTRDEMKGVTDNLIFYFTNGGWANEEYEVIVTIPYGRKIRNGQQFIIPAKFGTVEMIWKDPATDRKNIHVLCYPFKLGKGKIVCKEVENNFRFISETVLR